MLKLVPFNPVWINHDKIDVHAIYRRPRFKEDAYGELQRDVDANGEPTWDLTGGLPVRAHTKWTSKGFEYVTLSNRESLRMAGRSGTIPSTPDGEDWRQYDQHQTGGPWNWKKYHEGHIAADAHDAKQLLEDVYMFGSQAVQALRSRSNPDFALPEKYRNIAPGTPLPGSPEAEAKQNELLQKLVDSADAKANRKKDEKDAKGAAA
jgi:hypothetical protein